MKCLRKKVMPVLFVLLWSTVFAGAAKNITAEYVVKQKGGKAVKSKFYIKNTKVRIETGGKQGNQVIIIRPDKKVLWMVMAENKMAMEMPLQKDNLASIAKNIETWTTEKQKNAKLLGKEKIDGADCRKYRITENGETVTYWVTDEYPVPVKAQYKEATVEYKNISLKTISDAMFEVPSGYQVMSVPGMGGMFPGNMTGGGAKPPAGGGANHLER